MRNDCKLWREGALKRSLQKFSVYANVSSGLLGKVFFKPSMRFSEPLCSEKHKNSLSTAYLFSNGIDIFCQESFQHTAILFNVLHLCSYNIPLFIPLNSEPDIN